VKIVLDTNIFNWLVDDRFDLSALPPGSSLVATLVQLRELEATTKPPGRREKLLVMFEAVAPDIEPAAFSWDVPGAGWGEGAWSSDARITEIREALDARKPKSNNMQDALIAGVALRDGYALATADTILADVAERFGIRVHSVK